MRGSKFFRFIGDNVVVVAPADDSIANSSGHAQTVLTGGRFGAVLTNLNTTFPTAQGAHLARLIPFGTTPAGTPRTFTLCGVAFYVFRFTFSRVLVRIASLT
jgi:hypothetical protein